MSLSVDSQLPEFPFPPARVFMVGIGGIGMSGLAQLLHCRGYSVAGSDRDLENAARGELLGFLRGMGISLFPQDGSALKAFAPDCLIASSAVESDNPDLLAAGDLPVYGRSRAMASVLDSMPGVQIGVAGSCGKTSVTGWIASTLRALGEPVLMLCGGKVIDFEQAGRPGNFYSDPDPGWLVYETDESDGSLVCFTPDYGVLLNVGIDHFERFDLIRMFSQFLAGCGRGIVLPVLLREVFSVLPRGVSVATFSGGLVPGGTRGIFAPSDYSCTEGGMSCFLPGIGQIQVLQHGRHSAANAASVAALFSLPGLDPGGGGSLAPAMSSFQGIRQRFELMGYTHRGVPVYNDYAHNAEKIRAAVLTAGEIRDGPVVAVFQPHGFGPLGFMRAALREVLAEVLTSRDLFVFLPVYYAGGTTTFTPASEEVAAEYRDSGLPVESVPDRESVREILADEHRGAFLVMGARDPSLRSWTLTLTDSASPNA